jgi:DNA-binding NarL/FixJ family response regulator
MPCRLFLVEDQELVRSAMHAYFSAADDLEVAGEAVTVGAAIAALHDHHRDEALPDVLITDLALPDASGLELIEHVRRAEWPVGCLVLSGRSESRYVEAARRAGADGYVLKGNPNTYLAAVRSVAAGDAYCSDRLQPAWDRASPQPLGTDSRHAGESGQDAS